MYSDPTLLRIGSIILGTILLYSAGAQLRTGSTYGLTGKGRVHRDEEPGYFSMLLVARVALGIATILLGLFLP